MHTITLKLTDSQVEALKRRTGRSSASAAAAAWVAAAKPAPNATQMRRALEESSRDLKGGKGQRFKTAADALKWLES